MRLFKNKIFSGVIVVALITIVLGIISNFKNNVITNILNTVSTPVQSVVAGIIRPINEHLTAMDENEAYKKENERLIAEITRLKIQNRDVESYISENNRLKELLNLQEKQVDMKSVAANAVARDYGKWDKCITINKGSADGIKAGDPVITNEGVLGVVDSVGLNWAKIITIFDTGSAVGAKFTRTGDVGVVEGSQELTDLGKCKIEYISSAASVINGDILVTSGLGGVYPSGIMIGKISEVKVDAMGNVDYAVVEPSVKFDEVYEVLVITEFTENIKVEIEKKDDKEEKKEQEEEPVQENVESENGEKDEQNEG